MFTSLKTSISGLLVCLLSSCLFDSGSDRIVDDYEVVWIDVSSSRRLNKHEGLVPAYVFAAGHNSRFVFVKQYPLSQKTLNKIDKSRINYFIIERTDNKFQDKPIYGPLNKIQFDSLCSVLDITYPRFDHTYPDL